MTNFKKEKEQRKETKYIYTNANVNFEIPL